MVKCLGSPDVGQTLEGNFSVIARAGEDLLYLASNFDAESPVRRLLKSLVGAGRSFHSSLRGAHMVHLWYMKTHRMLDTQIHLTDIQLATAPRRPRSCKARTLGAVPRDVLLWLAVYQSQVSPFLSAMSLLPFPAAPYQYHPCWAAARRLRELINDLQKAVGEALLRSNQRVLDIVLKKLLPAELIAQIVGKMT